MTATHIAKPLGGILGHGLDVVDIREFSILFKEPALPFLDRYFTSKELAAAGTGVDRLARLAGRFATKEAVLKALGIGWGDGVSFTDVEVLTSNAGTPTVVLHRSLANLQIERHIESWLVSLSHAGNVAVASVIALGCVS
ncbi:MULTISPECIES: holo-ACP synthase [Burkholderiaceae]|uniref:Holo-[acyl-carrier-protein] synthase n=1 Tax=Paraburkholderia silvatlantica TaxID=321895 RepID=A0A2V4TG70_9BURK|nr:MULTISPECIES: holo-ACP synthase [Burkholderiaceae]MCE4124536.1 holo-ACP synthase [Burkholderia cepacia]PYE18371.1 holo-[acyl-carrier protein] synthase [Paraburkholderia silvatlantica]